MENLGTIGNRGQAEGKLAPSDGSVNTDQPDQTPFYQPNLPTPANSPDLGSLDDGGSDDPQPKSYGRRQGMSSQVGLRMSAIIAAESDGEDKYDEVIKIEEITVDDEGPHSPATACATTAEHDQQQQQQQQEAQDPTSENEVKFADVHVDPFVERRKKEQERAAKAAASGKPPPPEHILHPVEQDLLYAVFIRDEVSFQTVVQLLLVSVCDDVKRFPKAIKFFDLKHPVPKYIISNEMGSLHNSVMDLKEHKNSIFEEVVNASHREAEKFGLDGAGELFDKPLSTGVYTTRALRSLFSKKRCAKFGVPMRYHHVVELVATVVDQRSRVNIEMERPYTKATEPVREHIRVQTQEYIRGVLARQDNEEIDQAKMREEEFIANKLSTHALDVIDYSHTQLVLNMLRRATWLTWELPGEDVDRLSKFLQETGASLPKAPSEQVDEALKNFVTLEKLREKFERKVKESEISSKDEDDDKKEFGTNDGASSAAATVSNGKKRVTLTLDQTAHLLLQCQPSTRLVLPPVSVWADVYAIYLHAMQHLVVSSQRFLKERALEEKDKKEREAREAFAANLSGGITNDGRLTINDVANDAARAQRKAEDAQKERERETVEGNFAATFNRIHHAMKLIMFTLVPVSFMHYTKLMAVRQKFEQSGNQAAVKAFDERFKDQCLFFERLDPATDYGFDPRKEHGVSILEWFAFLVMRNQWLQMAPNIGNLDSFANPANKDWKPTAPFAKLMEMCKTHADTLRVINKGLDYMTAGDAKECVGDVPKADSAANKLAGSAATDPVAVSSFGGLGAGGPNPDQSFWSDPNRLKEEVARVLAQKPPLTHTVIKPRDDDDLFAHVFDDDEGGEGDGKLVSQENEAIAEDKAQTN